MGKHGLVWMGGEKRDEAAEAGYGAVALFDSAADRRARIDRFSRPLRPPLVQRKVAFPTAVRT